MSGGVGVERGSEWALLTPRGVIPCRCQGLAHFREVIEAVIGAGGVPLKPFSR